MCGFRAEAVEYVECYACGGVGSVSRLISLDLYTVVVSP